MADITPLPVDASERAKRQFRNCLGHFATGVTVVTFMESSERGAQPRGVTINSFASVSLDPPLILFCLGRRAKLLPAFKKAGAFAVNVLSHTQKPLAERFAKPGRAGWEGVAHHPAPLGSPLLAGGLAWLECQTQHVHPGGDHVIFLARVREFAYAETPEAPLLFYTGSYYGLERAEKR